MTINEAVSKVLAEYEDGLTAEEIYNKIVEKGLYKFGAQDPVAVVNIQICRSCEGKNYSHSSKKRAFKICGRRDNKDVYALVEQDEEIPELLKTPLDIKIEELKKRISVLEREYVEAISELESLEFEKKRLESK